MRSGRAGFVAVLVSIALLLPAAGAWAGAAPRAAVHPHPGGTVTVKVSVGDNFAFALSSDEVQPGDIVTITLIELGTTAHTFTLSSIANFHFNSSDSTSHLTEFFHAHAPLVNLSVNGTTGESHSETFTAPAYGEYEFVCLQSGHFSAGMFGDLGVGEPGSSSTVVTGPGWQVFAIGGGIASLVVITIVLAFVIGRRKGSVHEMSPERLGYPEGPAPPNPPHP